MQRLRKKDTIKGNAAHLVGGELDDALVLGPVGVREGDLTGLPHVVFQVLWSRKQTKRDILVDRN